jgi:hypothetical protein
MDDEIESAATTVDPLAASEREARWARMRTGEVDETLLDATLRMTKIEQLHAASSAAASLYRLRQKSRTPVAEHEL